MSRPWSTVHERGILQTELWGLRLLAFAIERGPAPGRTLDTTWVRTLGLGGRFDDGLRDEAIQKAIRKRRKHAEKACAAEGAKRSSLIFENVETFARALGLDAVERDVLALAVASHDDDLLKAAFAAVGAEVTQRSTELLARVLGHDRAAIQQALASSSVLASTGLVRLGKCHHYGHCEPTQLAYGFAELFCREHDGEAAMFARFFRHGRAARLARADYDHVEADVAVIVSLLKAAVAERTPGVNILVHGKPGTGKTELARMVASEAGAKLFEVVDDDEEGDPIQRQRRLSAYSLAQRLLANSGPAVLVFDELEDAFPKARLASIDEPPEPDKGWTVRMLETNAIPAIWLGNRISQIDPAFLRRFDYVLELGTPPAKVRKRVLARYANGLQVRDTWIERAARDERLTPAHIERATRVVRLVGAASPALAESTLERVLDRSLSATTMARPSISAAHCERFDLGALQASEDLGRVVEGLSRTRSGSICLYGPPGTGKTAFAHHVSTVLDCPLHVRRASDLLSPYVGETEQNLAEMFRRARNERAMIFLDEADSFFRSRARANTSWEVTQVNELLVQVEMFDGVFVCATNLVDQFDDASMRRFGLKIRFDPPNGEQRWRLFERLVQDAGASWDVDASALKAVVGRLAGITPGDFATVLRRARLLGVSESAAALAESLRREVRGKAAGSNREIGFVQEPGERA